MSRPASEYEVTPGDLLAWDANATIPDDWSSFPFGALVDLSTEAISPDKAAGLPYVGLEHLDPGSARVARWGDSTDVRSTKYLFRPGEILYGKLRPYLDKAALAEFAGFCSTDIMVFRTRPDVCAGYVVYLLHGQSFRGHAASTTAGVNHPRTSWSSLRPFSVPLPPLSEQRAIARVLQTVQQAREATERVIAAAREVKRSMLRHLFTYGPVSVEEADQVALKATEYGAVPARWEITPLSSCAEVQSGVTKGRDLGDDITVDVPYLRVANVQDGYLDLSEVKRISVRPSEVERYLLREGDVLMTEGGDPDKLGRGFVWRGELAQCIHQNHIFAVRPIPDLLDADFFSYLIQSDHGKAYFLKVAHRTTNLASINLTKLKGLPITLPALSEQREITRAMVTIDGTLRAEEQRKQALDTLFKSLLDKLMAGQIRVPVG